MAIATGNDPLSGAPDAGVRGRSAYGAVPSSQFSSPPAMVFQLPDPLADSNQDYMQVAVGPGPSAVSFPLQDSTGGGGVAAHPWKVRWHEDENKMHGQWEVLSPTANFRGIGVCEVMNKKATDTSGHTPKDDTGWYKLGTGGDLNNGDYKVVAHFKAAAKFGDASYRRPAVFVGIEFADDEPTDNVSTYAGDYASFTVAAIHVETDSDGEVSRRVSQFVSTPYTVDMAAIGAPCILGVDCAVSGSTLTVSRFGFDSENVSAAGVSGTVNLDLNAGSACTVWLHAEASDGKTTLELKEFGVTSSPATQYSDTDIYVCIYRISDYGTVVGDFRANMQNLPYYR